MTSVATRLPRRPIERRQFLIGVGMPAFSKLEAWGRQVRELFDGEMPYLVGSAAQGKQWRDVDVRVMLDDEPWAQWFGALPPRRASHDPKWNALCLAVAAWGRDATGLPIDFQVQHTILANATYHGVRQAIGLDWAHMDWGDS